MGIRGYQIGLQTEIQSSAAVNDRTPVVHGFPFKGISFTGRNRFNAAKASNRARGLSKNTGFLFTNLSRTEKERQIPTGHRPQSVEPLSRYSKIQNANSANFSEIAAKKPLDSITRSIGRVFSYPDPPIDSEVSEICLSRQSVPIPVSPIRPSHGPVRVLESGIPTCQVPASLWDTTSTVHRRLAHACTVVSPDFPIHGDHSAIDPIPRVAGQCRKVGIHPQPEVYLSGDLLRSQFISDVSKTRSLHGHPGANQKHPSDQKCLLENLAIHAGSSAVSSRPSTTRPVTHSTPAYHLGGPNVYDMPTNDDRQVLRQIHPPPRMVAEPVECDGRSPHRSDSPPSDHLHRLLVSPLGSPSHLHRSTLSPSPNSQRLVGPRDSRSSHQLQGTFSRASSPKKSPSIHSGNECQSGDRQQNCCVPN